MSELQISLLAIGIVAVLAVYGYGAWQQKRYRDRFGATFQAQNGDALYQGVLARKTAGMVDDSLEQDMEHFLSQTGPDQADETCQNIAAETDYIAVMFAASPLHAQALAPLWHRRFDFGKNLHVCGVPASGGSWEKVVAESQTPYDTFRVALQLADRSGAVSQARLEDFRDLMRDTAEAAQAEVNLPSVEEAVADARRLDAFCADVDQMIGLNILPSGEHILMGAEVAQVVARRGMVLKADGAFHLCDEQGHTLFSLGNFDGMLFQLHELEDTPVIGLSLQLDVPRVDQPARRFDQMLVLARAIGADLQAAVVDDDRVALDDKGIAKIRAHVAAIEKRMQARHIVPGSGLARRLFY